MTSLPLSDRSWYFRDATRREKWRAAAVPGCVHRDLLRHKLIPDPFYGRNELDLQWIEERDWEYRCVFDVPPALLDEEVVELVADGLDTVATVFVNNRAIATTENMFLGHRWNVKPRLRRGRNELRIRFSSATRHIRSRRLDHQPREFNDPVGRCSAIRKQQCQFGWDWGPRLVTAGIWRDIRLEAWSGNRLDTVAVKQHHDGAGGVTLSFTPGLARPEAGIRIGGALSIEGRIVAEISGAECQLSNPRLWWPNGLGGQPLYDLDLAVADATGRIIGRWRRRIGLRAIAFDRQRDMEGESFRFIVNGRPVFAKGANWIPAHSFVAGLTRADYARDLRAAAEVHMNMIRVWGGGIYESEDFYDLCDELGLMVWQDFMFAVTIQPGDDEFLRSAQAEAEHQARRLRHRACLALWCGNNEIEQLNGDLFEDPRLRAHADALFKGVLADAVRTCDGTTGYWPSSQYRGDGDNSHEAGEKRGDTHYWDVWHLRQPVKDYEKWRFRFVSEFGMQSYCSPETQATFCPAKDVNLFGREMENHQKNRSGNQRILDYISQRYRFPNTQEDLIYLSQINQAYAMQTAIEHYRRLMPHCMGALYWQLNDCWPVASWSSIESTGRWRALHYAARRFFAPALVTARLSADETTSIGNYRVPGSGEAHLHTVSDLVEPTPALLRWTLAGFDGRAHASGSKRIVLRYGESARWRTLDLRKLLARHGRDEVCLRISLTAEAGVRARGEPALLGENTLLFAPPRFLSLPRAKTTVAARRASARSFAVTFTSSTYQHCFHFEVDGVSYKATDNFFDLHPREPKTIVIECEGEGAMTVQQFRTRLRFHSLVDTYQAPPAKRKRR